MATKHQAAKFATGAGIGMVVGGAMGLAGAAAMQPKYQRTAKKGFNKALKTVADVLEAIA